MSQTMEDLVAGIERRDARIAELEAALRAIRHEARWTKEQARMLDAALASPKV